MCKIAFDFRLGVGVSVGVGMCSGVGARVGSTVGDEVGDVEAVLLEMLVIVKAPVV